MSILQLYNDERIYLVGCNLGALAKMFNIRQDTEDIT